MVFLSCAWRNESSGEMWIVTLNLDNSQGHKSSMMAAKIQVEYRRQQTLMLCTDTVWCHTFICFKIFSLQKYYIFVLCQRDCQQFQSLPWYNAIKLTPLCCFIWTWVNLKLNFSTVIRQCIGSLLHSEHWSASNEVFHCNLSFMLGQAARPDMKASVILSTEQH